MERKSKRNKGVEGENEGEVGRERERAWEGGEREREHLNE